MNAEDLRALQSPLKTAYRAQPALALVTLRAHGRIGDGITCAVDSHAGEVVAGLHPATGGNGTEACSGDMLLQALVACAGVTLRAVATAIGIDIREATVAAEGDIDFRGTLGVSKEVPVGFARIRLRFEIATDADPERVSSLVDLTERYCVVYQTLKHANPVAVSHEVRR